MAKKVTKAEAVNLGSADDLPDEYVPKGLVPEGRVHRTQVMFACAYETVWKGDAPRRDYEMWAGPFPTLLSCLDKIPGNTSIVAAAKRLTSVIARFNLDETDEVLYRWKEALNQPGKWVREKP